jgi:tRNA(Ile)-lysidine synthase
MASLGPFSARRRVAVACSGGADSLCLTLLAAMWGDVLALIVDHGLRASSAEEARATAALLSERGIANRVLTLSGVRPNAAAARNARYAALTAAARSAGMVDLLVGHHAGDQAETVLMRQLAGSGAAGLAGMAAIVRSGDMRLLRPLLTVAPARLRDTLRAMGADWVEDPSNRNPVYLRSRLRRDIEAAGTGPALASAAADHAAARAEAERNLAEELASRVTIFPEVSALLRPGPISPAALGAVVRTLGGAAHGPGTAALTRVASAPLPTVMHGVQLLAAGRAGDGWLVVREAAAMQAPVAATDGAVWDRRFQVHFNTSPQAGGSLTVGAVGAAASQLRRLSALPAVVLRTLPALRCDGVLAAVPHIGYRHTAIPEGLSVRFIPAHPLAGAPFEAPALGVPSVAAAWRAGTGGCELDYRPPC